MKKKKNQLGANKRAAKNVTLTLHNNTANTKSRIQTSKELGHAKKQEQDEKAKAPKKKSQAHK